MCRVKATLQEIFLARAGWHHTGKFATCTDFYRFDDSREAEEAAQEISKALAEQAAARAAKKAEKAAVVAPAPAPVRRIAEYGVWGGTRRHPKLSWEKVEGVVEGNWLIDDYGHKRALTETGSGS